MDISESIRKLFAGDENPEMREKLQDFLTDMDKVLIEFSVELKAGKYPKEDFARAKKDFTQRVQSVVKKHSTVLGGIKGYQKIMDVVGLK